MSHSTTYGNLRKERKFARQLYFGISLTIIAAMVLVYVISQMKSLYPYLPGSHPANVEEAQPAHPMEPTQ
ncbi:hypothetical protein CIK05_12050 [Bdellovibrio sp. qaytius]|nr:hypothetical protein CIK05_12050 [Bdellovibrio sp. qaytius]